MLPTHAENFGLAVAEALAHKLPVVTTTNAPWEGLEREGCGCWVPPAVGAVFLPGDRRFAGRDAQRLS